MIRLLIQIIFIANTFAYAGVKELYRAEFSKGPGAGFVAAEQIYLDHLKTATSFDWLPVEHNTKNYTDLNNYSVSLDLKEKLSLLKSDWASGKSSTKRTLDLALLLLADGNDSPECLTLIGSLYDETGDFKNARDYYWKAHLKQPFYNRANWGLTVLNEREKHDLSALKTKPQLSKEQAKLISKYVLNWYRMTQKEKTGFVFVFKEWLPNLKSLYDSGARAYVRRTHELTSDLPPLKYLRDQRLDYPNDFRLIDDLRGFGGPIVSVDFGAIILTMTGAFNLLSHEVGHQLYDYLDRTPNLHFIFDCVTKLYADAEKKNAFITPYSQTNENEFFAEAIAAAGFDFATMPTAFPDLWSMRTQVLNGKLTSFVCPVQ